MLQESQGLSSSGWEVSCRISPSGARADRLLLGFAVQGAARSRIAGLSSSIGMPGAMAQSFDAYAPEARQILLAADMGPHGVERRAYLEFSAHQRPPAQGIVMRGYKWRVGTDARSADDVSTRISDYLRIKIQPSDLLSFLQTLPGVPEVAHPAYAVADFAVREALAQRPDWNGFEYWAVTEQASDRGSCCVRLHDSGLHMGDLWPVVASLLGTWSLDRTAHELLFSKMGHRPLGWIAAGVDARGEPFVTFYCDAGRDDARQALAAGGFYESVQLEKLEERVLLSAEPLLQLNKTVTPVTADNVVLDLRAGTAVDSQRDTLMSADALSAQIIDLSKDIDQNAALLTWEADGLMKLGQGVNGLMLDLGAGSDTVRVSNLEDGRIKVASDSLYDLVFAKPVNFFGIRGGSGVDRVIFDNTHLGGAALSVDAESIVVSEGKTVTAGRDVVFLAMASITQTPSTSTDASVTSLVDVQGALVTKGLVTLSARSAVDMKSVLSGSTANLSLSATANADARVGKEGSVSAAGLQVIATTDMRLVAELSGVSSGLLALSATQSSHAALLGNAQVVIAARSGDSAPQVLVEASGLTQLRGVVGMSGNSAEDTIDPTRVNGTIKLDRSVLADVGDGTGSVVVRAADGQAAPSLSVSAYTGDRASGGVYGQMVASPYGAQANTIKNRVGVLVNTPNSDPNKKNEINLDLSRLDLMAMDRSTYTSIGRTALNTGDTATSSLLKSANVKTSGAVTAVALDAATFSATGGGYKVDFTGDGTLGVSQAGNLVVAQVSSQIDSSNVDASNVWAYAKGAQILNAKISASELGPISSGQINEWVDVKAQRAWNQFNGGVQLDINASTLTLSGGLAAGASAQAKIKAIAPAGAMQASVWTGLDKQESSYARNVVGWSEESGNTLSLSKLGGGESGVGSAYLVQANLRDSNVTAKDAVSLEAQSNLQLDALTGALLAGTGSEAAAALLLKVGATGLVAANRLRSDTTARISDSKNDKKLQAGGAVTVTASDAAGNTNGDGGEPNNAVALSI
eukprot:gene16069-18350_t